MVGYNIPENHHQSLPKKHNEGMRGHRSWCGWNDEYVVKCTCDSPKIKNGKFVGNDMDGPNINNDIEWAFSLVGEEIIRAYKNWPMGSDDPKQHMTIIMEELGEAARPLNDEWNSGKEGAIKEFRKEMIQVAAMAIRALMEVW